jgi:peptide/nickel transport system permease protein
VSGAGVNQRKTIGFYLATAWMFTCVFMAIFGDLLPFPDHTEYDFENTGVGLFSSGHILGTDLNGIDMLSATIHATRLTLVIAFTCVAISLVIGGALGVIAAYWRGRADSILSTYFNVTLSIPNLVLTLVLVAILATPDPANPGQEMPRSLVIIISLTFAIIPILGRLARSSALTWSGREFIRVAESIGMKKRQIAWTHIVPNVIPSLLSVGFLAAGVVIVAEGGLAILGVGTDAGESWGSLLASKRTELTEAPHTTLVPAVAIALTVMSLNFFGDYLRKKIDNREARI